MKLGILAMPFNHRGHFEEQNFFKQIAFEATVLGIDVQVYTPDQLGAEKSNLDLQIRTLRDSSIDVIWDRCRWQRSEPFQRFQLWRKQILTHSRRSDSIPPWMNEPFVNKWRIYDALQRDNRYEKKRLLTDEGSIHHTDQRLFRTPHSLEWSKSFAPSILYRMHHFPLIYFKPLNGTGGRGIMRIRTTRNGYLLDGQDGNRQLYQTRCKTIEELCELLTGWTLRTGNIVYKQRYVVQQGIATELDGQRVHDYRALVQKNQHGRWVFAGYGARIGAKSNSTSNLHAGGEALNGDQCLQQWLGRSASEILNTQIQKASIQLADWVDRTISKQCELGIDWAIDRDANLWLLEVNPKPGHQLFEKVSPSETYASILRHPLHYATFLHRLMKKEQE